MNTKPQRSYEGDFGDLRLEFRDRINRFLEDISQDISESALPLSFAAIMGDSCCSTCASSEAGVMCEWLNKPYYLYWSIQDEEDLNIRGDGLYIGFGGRAGTEQEAREAGKFIETALTKCGYEVEWDGDIGRRIIVKTYFGRGK